MSQDFFANRKVLPGLNSQSQSDAGDTIARVLVPYTPAAKDSVGGTNSMIALIKNSIEEANASFDSSDVPIYLELAHNIEVQYTEIIDTQTQFRECPESSDFLKDLLRLQNPSDGYMDNVHSLRDTYAADIVVLMFDPVSSLGGQAYDIGASSNGAFCVVNYATADGPSWSFAHEIGHLYGGRHEFGEGINEDPCLPPAPFGNGHGHILGAGAYRTIMGVNQGIRIQYWSDPQKTFQGMPLGETDVSETAIVLTQRAGTVADFRTQPVSDVATALSANSQRKVVTNQDGTEYHMVFESNGEIHYVKSTNEGATWTSETLVSSGDGSNAYPSIAINEGDGSLYVAWQRDLGNGSYDILFNKRSSSGWGTVETVTPSVSPPSGTLPQPVISVKRSGTGVLVNKILVMYISSSNSLKYRYSSNGGSSWSSEQTLNSSGRFRPSLTPPWSLNITGVNVVDVVSDTGLKLYRNRYVTQSSGSFWFDQWQGEELVPASSDNSFDSVINAQIVGGQGNNHLDFIWELDQTISGQPVEAVCYQRRSFYTGQWSAMKEFAGDNHQKPTISYLKSGNVVVVWDDGTNVLQAKYTQSTNSWSGVSNLGAGLEPHISTSGGDIEPDKAKYVYRDASGFPYPLNTQSGAAFQKVIAGGNFLPETYARRISATDTLTGAGFLVELEIPKVKTTSGNLYDLPFVVTNDTLLNLSLNNLAPYLNTQSGTLPLDSDSLIFEVKIHSKDAASLGTAGNLIPTVTVRPDATPGLALPVQLGREPKLC